MLHTFHLSGKLNASFSDIFFTKKSLNKNHGLERSFLRSASGTRYRSSGTTLVYEYGNPTFDDSHKMVVFVLQYDLSDYRLDTSINTGNNGASSKQVSP